MPPDLLVEGRQAGLFSPPPNDGRAVAPRGGQGPCCLQGAGSQRPPPGVQPAIELRGGIPDEESGEQVASVEGERLGGAGIGEDQSVAPEGWSHGHLLGSPGAHGVGAEVASEKMKRLPQGVPAAARVELGPKKRQQYVAALPAGGDGEGQVGKDGEAFGLHRDGVDGGAAIIRQTHAPQGPQADHIGSPTVFGFVRVTLR